MRHRIVPAALLLALGLGLFGCADNAIDTETVALAAATPVPVQTVAGVPAEIFDTADSSRDPQVLFIHGGSYVHEASSLHAPFFDEILSAVPATITMPVYALAPEHGYTEAYEQVLAVYLELRRSHPDSPVVLMGGSAGGGFALGFAQHLVQLGLPQPDRIVLISPWLDLTLQNPRIEAVDNADVLLDRDALVPHGLAWAHGDDPTDYRLSPINGSLESLAPVMVLIGTQDLLYPDVQRLRAAAELGGLDFDVHVYEGADHVFAMSPGPAGDDARSRIEAVISGLE
jgi:monoterpene epsilon-lactone hydrolase